MSTYSIDCYGGIGGDPFTFTGCFVDSSGNRVLPDGLLGQPEMSATVSAHLLLVPERFERLCFSSQYFLLLLVRVLIGEKEY